MFPMKLRYFVGGAVLGGALMATTVVGTAGAAQRTIHEQHGVMKMVEGRECGVYDGHDPGLSLSDLEPQFAALVSTGPKVSFRGQWDLPSYADQATIFLNGWSGNYINHDHEVESLGAVIDGVETVSGALRWSAGVDLQDKNGDDSIEACYYYTALAWNSARIDARVLPPGALRESGDIDGDGRLDAGTARRKSIRWQLEDGTLDAGERVAVLPTSLLLEYGTKDRHLFHMGWALGQLGETGRNRVQARAVLRDDKRRVPWFVASVEALAGRGVEAIHGRFRLSRPSPRCRNKLWGGCIGGLDLAYGVHSERVEESDLAYDFVVPVLTGYDMYFDTNDQHVKRIGAWLDQIEFDAADGRLSYRVSTALQDKNASPGFTPAHDVTLVAFTRTVRPTTHPEVGVQNPEIDAGPTQPQPQPSPAPLFTMPQVPGWIFDFHAF